MYDKYCPDQSSKQIREYCRLQFSHLHIAYTDKTCVEQFQSNDGKFTIFSLSLSLSLSRSLSIYFYNNTIERGMMIGLVDRYRESSARFDRRTQTRLNLAFRAQQKSRQQSIRVVHVEIRIIFTSIMIRSFITCLAIIYCVISLVSVTVFSLFILLCRVSRFFLNRLSFCFVVVVVHLMLQQCECMCVCVHWMFCVNVHLLNRFHCILLAFYRIAYTKNVFLCIFFSHICSLSPLSLTLSFSLYLARLFTLYFSALHYFDISSNFSHQVCAAHFSIV